MRTLQCLVSAVALAAANLFVALPAQAAETAICYNCPPEWADWGSQLKVIQSRLGIQVPPDNKNSGQSIAAMIAEVITPLMFAPSACGRMIAPGLAAVAIFCTIFAVVGTQLTPAIPMTGLNFPPVAKYMT